MSRRTPCESTRRWLLPALLACLLLVPAAGIADPPATAAPGPQKVLFVGNSFTYFNNSLHGKLRLLLTGGNASRPTDYFLKAMTISGERLSSHEGGLRHVLDLYDWDIVVLQGHSLEAVDPEQRPGLAAAAETLAGLVREHGAEPVLFMTWAYADRPEMTDALNRVYTALGKRLGLRVVPVGLAFAEALARIPDLRLHHADNIHPSPEGSYLAACVFYAALYDRSPAGLEYNSDLDEALARQLQRSAWQTVSNYDKDE